ncbi:MAG TPA: hypothetical protein VMB02_10905 [Candidatus Aquilonibacter sp.]|nr:hypothetical protein [Candidatus Aquilonibacter sp.]
MAGKAASTVRWAIAAAIVASLLAPGAQATDLEPKTVEAFDRYVQQAETQIDAQLAKGGPFLWVESLPPDRGAAAEAQLRAGQVVIERLDATDAKNLDKPISVPGGMIHHWIGTVFIPGATLQQTLALVEDYDHQQEYYRPDVMRSKTLRHDGNDFTIELRLYKKKVIATVLDTEHQVHYTIVDATHAWSRSRTTRIQEVDDAGQPDEHLEPEGHDHGFLWRMNTYWRFEQKDGGTYVESQSISLTRDIPTGLGWLVGPFVNSVPRESLTFTLTTTRAAVLERISSRKPPAN